MPINDVVTVGIEAVASWCTPACLFCFVNLMIGAIYIRSTLNPLRKQRFNDDDQRRPQSDRIPSQFDRVPSILQRIKSINLSRQPDPVHHVTRTRSNTTVEKKAPAPVRVLEKSASEKVLPADKAEMDQMQRRPATVREKTAVAGDEAVDASSQSDRIPSQFDRVPSFLQRIKSINLSRQPDPLHHVTRTRSDTTVEKKAPAPVRVLEKSASEKVLPAEKAEKDQIQRRPATVREKTAATGDEAVDAKADDFINRFRQQLKLQRLDSILRYKEILDRGTAR